jgi:hypothetical protein
MLNRSAGTGERDAVQAGLNNFVPRITHCTVAIPAGKRIFNAREEACRVRLDVGIARAVVIQDALVACQRVERVAEAPGAKLML